MEFSVDIFINADNNRYTGIVMEHPDGGGHGEVVYKKTGFANDDMAAAGCDRFIEKQISK